MTDDVFNDRAEAIVAFIAASVKDRGYPPTVREIGEQVGLSSPSTVHWYLRRLVKAGRITVEPGKVRTLRVVA